MIGWLIALVLASGSPPETACAKVWFDLRDMPVNSSESALRARRWGLSEKVRKAAGEPAPEFIHSIASTIFTARFVGAGAQARCEAAIAAAVPVRERRRGLRPRFGPKASQCGACPP